MKDKKVSAVITVNIPIRKDLTGKGFPLNLGALTLSLGKRNFVLDSMQTNLVSGRYKKGKNLLFHTRLEVDKDTFEEGEEFNYELTERDLKNKKLKSEFFCSDEDAEIKDAFDFNKATITCSVSVNGKYYNIKTKFE